MGFVASRDCGRTLLGTVETQVCRYLPTAVTVSSTTAVAADSLCAMWHIIIIVVQFEIPCADSRREIGKFQENEQCAFHSVAVRYPEAFRGNGARTLLTIVPFRSASLADHRLTNLTFHEYTHLTIWRQIFSPAPTTGPLPFVAAAQSTTFRGPGSLNSRNANLNHKLPICTSHPRSTQET